MTEIGIIYDKINELRGEKTLNEIEAFLIASNYSEDSVKHAIAYVRASERHDEFLLKDSGYNLFIATAQLVVCYLLVFLSATGTIYFTVKLLQVISTPDVLTRGRVAIIFDSFDKGKLTLYLAISALFTSFIAIGLFSVARSILRDRKKLTAKLDAMKNRKR